MGTNEHGVESSDAHRRRRVPGTDNADDFSRPLGPDSDFTSVVKPYEEAAGVVVKGSEVR
ncbi:hypothetical protein [Mycolicibacterium pyrenivorans]|uniref:hypothetical protein n=1 Tax=Mycolicibacterium pyrenivorans TaxID=187102 RepID=UPI0021F3BB3E|nr:hypothetical protein [Mycolicibacterium pyrenivorans]MCV7152465.1 hypothetical protein [Mycolicibacterium pyrenivorans]